MLRSLLGPYRRILRSPGVVGPFLFTFLGSLPISMLGLGVLLLIRSTTGSIALAGIAGGAFSIGNAIGLLLQGRLFDRHGQTVILTVTGLGCGVSVTLLVIVASRDLFAASVVLAATSGALLPGVITSLRVLIPVLVPDPAERTAAYALQGTQFAIATIGGPLLVSGLVIAGGAGAAVLATAVIVVGASLSFAATKASRAWRPPKGVASARRRLPLTGGFGILLLAGLGGGIGSGLTTVGVTAASGEAALAGLLFAALSAGDLVGGFVYGSRPWRTTGWSRLVLSQLLAAAGHLVLAVCTARPILMFPGLFALGSIYAPATITTSALLDDVVHKGEIGRAYTSLVASSLVGMAIGTTLGGKLADALHATWAPFAVASVTMLVVAAFVRRSATRQGVLARTP